MKTKIILLSGQQGSGKTTLMNALKRYFTAMGTRTQDVIFADTIYKIHDYAINLLEQRGVKRDIVKDGKLLQLLGTEWGRETLGEDIWVRCLMGEIERLQRVTGDANTVFIVSDCRFENEFDGVPGAFKVRLEASREVRKARCSQWRENDTHRSEIDLNKYAREGKFDCYVDTELDLDRSVREILMRFNEHYFGIPKEKGTGFLAVHSKYYQAVSDERP
jgi:dephospho-CoA kinase